jgi:hypothetical protein
VARLSASDEIVLRPTKCMVAWYLFVHFGRSVEVAQRRNHQSAVIAVDGEMVGEAVGLPCGAAFRERRDRAPSHEMHGGLVFVQVCKDGGEGFARVKLLGWRRIFGVHVDDEVGIRREEGHLTFSIAPVGAIGVGLDEFADRKSVGGFGMLRLEGGSASSSPSCQSSALELGRLGEVARQRAGEESAARDPDRCCPQRKAYRRVSAKGEMSGHRRNWAQTNKMRAD